MALVPSPALVREKVTNTVPVHRSLPPFAGTFANLIEQAHERRNDPHQGEEHEDRTRQLVEEAFLRDAHTLADLGLNRPARAALQTLVVVHPVLHLHHLLDRAKPLYLNRRRSVTLNEPVQCE